MSAELANAREAETVFNIASALSPEQRTAYLDHACGTDLALRKRVEALLQAHVELKDFLPDTPKALVGGVTFLRDAEKSGDIIGRYKLLEKIGEGGMGVVYMAEQEEPVRRKVALKIIKLGMDTRQVVARFEAERQALALMDHPNVAKVLDAGATDTGRPYFVMELVNGVPITQFCEQNQLPIHDRLQLFIAVCQAIQHAHQKGIIHRDIKPGNILVTCEYSGAPGVPKVIDFGIAKAINQKLTEKTLFTNFATMIGTPAYMSPEQAEMSKLDVDTRSDIYSLGVLLYELLTGTTPFPEKQLRSVAYREMQRIIVEEEPERPSTRLTKTLVAADVRRRTSGESDASADSRRRLQAAITLLRGDLDWIVMKCLEKDRARRYETASGLAADISRFLGNEPIVARPPSVGYRMQKAIRRNKIAFVATTTIMLTLLAGIGVSSWQAVRANRESERSELRLQEIVKLMNTTFENVVPSLAYTIGATKPREELANAAFGIVKELQQESEFRPEFRPLLGQLYLHTSLIHTYYIGNTTGDYAQGLDFALKAVRILGQAQDGELNATRLYRLAMAEMSAGFASQGLLRPEAALDFFGQMRQTAGLLRKSSDARAAQQGLMLDEWSRGLTGGTLLQMDKADEALTNYFLPLLEKSQKRAAVIEDASLQEIWDLRDLLDSVGRCHLRLGNSRDAVDYLREALRLAEINQRRNPSHAACETMLAESKARLGESLLGVGKSEEALPLLEAALQRADELRKLDPPNPGFVQLKVQILQSQANGYAGWATINSGSPVEQVQRLQLAEQFLKQARELVTALVSESLRMFLGHELQRTDTQLRNVRGLMQPPLQGSSPTTQGGGNQ